MILFFLKKRKRINELLDLNTHNNIHQGMTTQQILLWVNSLLKQFSLKIRAISKQGEGYKLEVLNDILGIIKRKNQNDRFYEDCENRLKQEGKDGDPFLDEATGETIHQKQEKRRQKKMRDFDTSLLDRGIDFESN